MPALSAGQRLHEGTDLAFRNRAHEAVDGLSVLEGVHGRNRLDAQLPRDLLVLVDVDLDELDGALRLSNDLFDCRPELLARPAPRRPEIHDHWNLARSLQYVGRECGERAVL